MCELLVGLPEVTVLGIDDAGRRLAVHVETNLVRAGCATCGTFAVVKERPEVSLVDLPVFGRPTRPAAKARTSCRRDTPQYYSSPADMAAMILSTCSVPNHYTAG